MLEKLIFEVSKAPHALNLVIRDAGYAALPKNKIQRYRDYLTIVL
jgi:hypothetical protein